MADIQELKCLRMPTPGLNKSITLTLILMDSFGLEMNPSYTKVIANALKGNKSYAAKVKKLQFEKSKEESKNQLYTWDAAKKELGGQ